MKIVEIIAGPTASGKSQVALDKLYQNPNYEIINADSMQLYKDLKILTARPDEDFHLYGIVDASFQPDVGWWRQKAMGLIEDFHTKNKIPLLVGGTGFYIKALLHGLAEIPPIPAAIKQEIEHIPKQDLWEYAIEKDPLISGKLVPQDTQRIKRALSVKCATGKSLYLWHQEARQNKPTYDFKLTLCMPEKSILHRHIEKRFHQMINEGAIDEVVPFLDTDYPINRAIGFKPISMYLKGSIKKEDMIERCIIETKQYAKRQITFFKSLAT